MTKKGKKHLQTNQNPTPTNPIARRVKCTSKTQYQGVCSLAVGHRMPAAGQKGQGGHWNVISSGVPRRILALEIAVMAYFTVAYRLASCYISPYRQMDLFGFRRHFNPYIGGVEASPTTSVGPCESKGTVQNAAQPVSLIVGRPSKRRNSGRWQLKFAMAVLMAGNICIRSVSGPEACHRKSSLLSSAGGTRWQHVFVFRRGYWSPYSF